MQQEKYIDAINVLLRAGADPNITDDHDDTCLHHSLYGDCSKEVIEAIIKHGADVNTTNKINGTALGIACYKGNIGAIKVLLSYEANIHIATSAGTCLHYAVYGDCSKEVLELIIKHGADVNATNNFYVTALLIACHKGNIEAIYMLLSKGTSPRLATRDGTCLHYAVYGDCSKEVLETITNHGADVNVTDKKNRTALMKACNKRNINALNVLLRAGADPKITDDDGNTSLHHAVRGGCSKEVLETLINHGADVNATNKNNITPLIKACNKRNKNAINVLLHAEADPKITDDYGYTCLHHAVAGDCSKEVLETIINHGADVNATNKNNTTALITACNKDKINAIKVLLRAGADPKITDESGDACLHHVVYGAGDCSKEVLEPLINHGADVNATNNYNETALIIACSKRNTDAINILLSAGADPNIADDASDTCLRHAVRKDCSKEVLETIIKHGTDVNATNNNNQSALMIACYTGNIDAINVLLRAEADPNIIDKISGPALRIACYRGDIDAINVLLHAGADPNITDGDGDTSIHHAVRGSCSTEALETIINHDVDVNITNKNNRTALMKACTMRNTNAINVLLRAGADPNITDNDGNTSLHHAVEGGCSKDVLETIINHGGDVNATNKNNRTSLMIACYKRNIDSISVLLFAATDSNFSDVICDTCLHKAVRAGCNIQALQVIIDHCADVNAVNNEGATALLVACDTGQKESVNVLLRAGADTTIADVSGDTCLHKVLNREFGNETLQILIDHGAPVNATNKNHQTAYMLARNQENLEAMLALVYTGADPNIDSGEDNGAIICCGGCFSS